MPMLDRSLLALAIHVILACANASVCLSQSETTTSKPIEREISDEDLRKILEAHAEWIEEGMKQEYFSIFGFSKNAPKSFQFDNRRANLRSTNLKGRRLNFAILRFADVMEANLAGAMLEHANLGFSNLKWADLSGAYLTGAKLNSVQLQGADLNNSELRRADLSAANLEGVELTRADLTEANLSFARIGESSLRFSRLEAADLTGADLRHARLWQAKLNGADLSHTILEGAVFDDADLAGVRLDGIDWGVAGIDASNWRTVRGLDQMHFHNSEESMVELRSAFRAVNLDEQARELSYSISRGRTYSAIYGCCDDSWGVLNATWAAFAYVAFELTVEYGSRPFRALQVLIASIFPFCIIYYILPMMFRQSTKLLGEFIRVEIDESPGSNDPNDPRIKLSISSTPRHIPLIELGRWRFRDALWFSFLSATHFGVRAFSVQTIFRRLQREEYVVEPTLWLRSISGIQSIFSLYLLAIFAATYLQSRVL